MGSDDLFSWTDPKAPDGASACAMLLPALSAEQGVRGLLQNKSFSINSLLEVTNAHFGRIRSKK